MGLDKEKAETTSTTDTMHIDMSELISDDEQPTSQKHFTFRKPPSQRPPHK